MWEIMSSLGNLSQNVLAVGVAAIQVVYYGFRLNSQCWKITGLLLLVGCNMGIILMPYFYGFAQFGDASKHLIWIEETINGETSLLGSYYLSWYAISVFLVKYLHFQLNWLMVVYPVVTYTVFILGFYLLAGVVGKSNLERGIIFLPATAFLFGLSNFGMMPYYFGVMLVPILIALQFRLADKFRPGLAWFSLLLFCIIGFSHPQNFLFCSIFVATFWLIKKNQRRWVFPALGAIFVVVAIHFMINRKASMLLGWWATTFFGGMMVFPLFGNAPHIFFLYLPQISLLLTGVIASIYFLRRGEYMPVVVLFWAGLNIGIWAISGVFLLRGFTRMFAYALMMSLILLGLLLRELLLTKPRAAKCLFGYVVASYFISALGIIMRFPGLYLRMMRFD